MQFCGNWVSEFSGWKETKRIERSRESEKLRSEWMMEKDEERWREYKSDEKNNREGEKERDRERRAVAGF